MLTLIVCVLCLVMPSEQGDVKILHMSDLHLDSLYSVTGHPGEDRCHDKAESGDEGGNRLGVAGNYACDPPAALIESAIMYMNASLPRPDVIVWSGDNSPHWVKGPDFNYIFSNLKNITSMIVEYFPDVPVIPALGNHDTYPPDNYPDSKVSKTLDFYDKYIEQGAFGDFLGGEARASFKFCGYYAKTVNTTDSEKLKFIVLNTNLYYRNNELLDFDDPCGQLSWLENELVSTEEDEQVFIVSHIPPGFFERNVTSPMFNVANGDHYNAEYFRIFTNESLSRKIKYHFYGHTHTDAFRLFVDNETDTVRGVAFNAPSITPSIYLNRSPHGVNPGVRVYHYDCHSQVMTDYEQHYLPLEEANKNISRALADRRSRNSKYLDDNDEEGNVTVGESGQDGGDTVSNGTEAEEPDPIQADDAAEAEDEIKSIAYRISKFWKWGYNATEALQVKNLSFKQMQVAFEDMKRQGSEGKVFKQYYKHNTLYHVTPDTVTCPDKCHRDFMCAMVSFTSSQMTDCLQEGLSSSDVEEASSDNENVVEDAEKQDDDKPPTTLPPLAETTLHGAQSTMTTMTSTTTTTASTTTTTASASMTTTTTPTEPVVKLDAAGADHSVRGFVIGFSIVLVLALAVGGLFVYKRMQRNRYRSQEFLLTDNVFRYDGYEQLEVP